MQKFSISLPEEAVSEIDAAAAAAGISRAEWIRIACTRVMADGGRIDGNPTEPPEEHRGTLEKTMVERDQARQDLDTARARVADLAAQVLDLSAALGDEKDGRIQDLKTAEARLVEQAERFQVLLQGAQQALPPPRRSVRQWIGDLFK